MTEFIVCSDNHGAISPLELIPLKYPNIKTKIHCGDVELPPQYLEGYDVISGNNDFSGDYPDTLIVEVDNIRILVIHGHQYYFDRLEKLAKRAINNHCQVVCFGHTHVFEEKLVNGVLCINPGSLRYNRDGTEPSYAYVQYDGKDFHVERRNVADL